MTEDEMLTAYFMCVNRLGAELNGNNDYAIGTSNVLGVTLQGLWPKYHTIHTVLQTDNGLKLEDAKAKLHTFKANNPDIRPPKNSLLYARHQFTAPAGKTTQPASSHAFQRQYNNSKPSPGKPWRERPRCTHCHKLGHTFDVCWARLGQEPKANLAIASEHIVALMATAGEAARTTGERTTWYLDTGATQHMTCQRDWLHDYRDIPAQTITFGDNSKISTVSVGTIVVNNDYNGTKIRIELREVLYVPRLEKNLISMSRLVTPQRIAKIDSSSCTL